LISPLLRNGASWAAM